ncbi:PREDICTED: uncharacterized protein C1orf105 homolog [Capra hircus]|uniref:uncharacterized protein C1orf105 homolog n=1 Tax=Capra hircus TaxID=9925 RepID=UPI0008467113|nr:PREDICTED: uncharacterized protein C1orf105 homolog [Capra hircus]
MSLLPPPGHLRGTSSSSPKEESSEPGKLIFNSETRNVASSYCEVKPSARDIPCIRATTGHILNKYLQVSAPRFDKIPWFSEASFMNKPLVLSLPKRYPHSSATFLVASKKDMNLPILFQVPDVLSKARWNQNDPTLIRNKQLCSTCRDVKMVQPKTLIIPDDLKQSFANIMNHRMMSLHPPKAQTVPKRSCDDILTENVHYRLPILGPRTAVFHGLLSDAYETLRETELSSLPSKEPVSKAVNQ